MKRLMRAIGFGCLAMVAVSGWGQILDTNPPVILSYVSKIQGANSNGVAVVPDFTVTLMAMDNVTASNELIRAQSPLAGTVVGLGTTPVTLTVRDAAGNSSTGVTTFVVIDATPPLVQQCAPPVTNHVSHESDQVILPDFTAGVTATDNCTPSGLLTMNQSPSPGTMVGVGTLAVTISIRDAASNTSTCVADFIVVNTNSPVIVSGPEIAVGPVVTNAWLQLDNLATVVVGETNVFDVAVTIPDDSTVRYQWNFGDGVISGFSTQSLAQHVYSTNCGPYSASVIVSNAAGVVTSNFTMSIACELNLSKLGMGVSFAAPNRDSASLKAVLDLGPAFVPFVPGGLRVAVDIGGALVDFTLDDKGRGVNGSSSCRLAYKKPSRTKPASWTLTVKFSQGTWNDEWDDEGLINETTAKPGVSVVVPMVVVVGEESFAAKPTLTYTAVAGKSGKAK